MAKPTILHIAPTPFFADRGCHIRIEGIARSLATLGFENTVCTYHHGRDVNEINTKRISDIKAYTQTAAGPSKYKPWADWKLLWLAFREYRIQRPSAIHAHLHEGLMIGLCLKLMFFWHRTPLVADIQGSLSGELDTHGAFKKLPFLKWPTRLLERILLMCANHIVCSSSHSMSKIIDEFGMSSAKVSLAQDGAKASPNLNEQQRAEICANLNLNNIECLIVYSGALLDAKGLSELKLVLLESKGNSKLHFLIIGYPTENLTPFLQEHGLDRKCSLTGQVPFEELSNYLHLANIAIDPKCSDAGEGSGKMLNYIAAGLPVVAFSSQNNADFLPEGTELASSPKDMVGLLEKLSEDDELRAEVAKRNFAHFEKFYGWKVTIGQLKKVYQKLIR